MELVRLKNVARIEEEGAVEAVVWEGRVGERCDSWEGNCSRRIGLVICCFCLDVTGKDVLSVCELVLIKTVVLNCCANQPDRIVALNEQATSSVNCDLS